MPELYDFNPETKTIKIGDGIKEFDENFELPKLKDLTNISLDLNQVEKIVSFSSSYQISTVIGNSVTEIAAKAFYNCSSLKQISFPEVTIIEFATFSCCMSLEKISFSKVTTIKRNAFMCCESLKQISFPEVTHIGQNAFASCTSLNQINVPKVTLIGVYAFWACQKLTTVNIPSIKVLRKSSFAGCISLKSVQLSPDGIPPNVQNIDLSAFDNCPNLTNIFISPSALTIFKDMTTSPFILLNREALKTVTLQINDLIDYTPPVLPPHMFSGCVGINKVILVWKKSISKFFSIFKKENEIENFKFLIPRNAFLGCNGINYVSIRDYFYLTIKSRMKFDHTQTRRFFLCSFLHLKKAEANFLHVLDETGKVLSIDQLNELIKKPLSETFKKC